jgi:hypothetical protein
MLRNMLDESHTIEFNTRFEDILVPVKLKYDEQGEQSYYFISGHTIGRFFHGERFGWEYYGDPLEFNDLVIIIDRIVDYVGYGVLR